MADKAKITCDDVRKQIGTKVINMAEKQYPQYNSELFVAYVPSYTDKTFTDMFEKVYKQKFEQDADCKTDPDKNEQIARQWLPIAVHRQAPCVLQENVDLSTRMEKVSDICYKIDDVNYGVENMFSLQPNENGETEVDEFFNDINNKIMDFRDSFRASHIEDPIALAEVDKRIDEVIESLEDIKRDIENALDPERDEYEKEELQEEISGKVEETKDMVSGLEGDIVPDDREDFSTDYEEDISDEFEESL